MNLYREQIHDMELEPSSSTSRQRGPQPPQAFTIPVPLFRDAGGNSNAGGNPIGDLQGQQQHLPSGPPQSLMYQEPQVTPHKAMLRTEVAQLREHLECSQFEARQVAHQALGIQRANFEAVAERYQQEAKDRAQVQV